MHKDLHQYTVFQHEAGHFLVGYMLGILPKRYKVPSVEDLSHDKFAHGKVEFVGFEFLKVSATSYCFIYLTIVFTQEMFYVLQLKLLSHWKEWIMNHLLENPHRLKIS